MPVFSLIVIGLYVGFLAYILIIDDFSRPSTVTPSSGLAATAADPAATDEFGTEPDPSA
ncbi:MAG: hypothetical protein AAGJ29_06415 [Pseudomonadota bacterium]